MAELFDNIMNMMLTSQYERIEAVQQALCIAVIDESDSDIPTTTEWSNFRASWPARPYYLLHAKGATNSYINLNIPSNMATDLAAGGLSNGPIVVNRDDGSFGDPAVASDWFSICNVAAHYNSPSFVGDRTIFLFVDDSGSMTLQTVGQSLELFINSCNNAAGGRIQIKAVVNARENYVLPFIAFNGVVVNDICDMPFVNSRNWLNAAPRSCNV